jgi:hypothetical protein
MSSIVKKLGRLSALVFALILGPLNAGEPPPTWKAGVARVDTTSTVPVRMAGYGSRTAPSQGVAHPLVAKALALADATGHKVVMVTCDIIAFGRTFTNRVKDRVKGKYGLPHEDVVMFASHNHAGPALIEPAENGPTTVSPRDGFQNNVAYTKGLEDKLVNLIGEALAKMEPASLSYGVGRAHFALNRREPTANGIKLNDPNSGRKNHAKRMIETLEQGRPIRTEYPHYSAHAIALGDQLTLLGLSGEVVVDYAIRLQKELGGAGQTLWVAAYANDVVGYIPSVRVLREGGYEGGDAYYGSIWPVPFAEDVESIVVNAASDVVKKVRQQ